MKKIQYLLRRLIQGMKRVSHLLRLSPKQNQTPDQTNKYLASSYQNLKRGLLYKGLIVVAAFVMIFSMIFAKTAAWYNNVVRSGSLVFEVNQWGMDGNVSLEETLRKASPGDQGFVTLEVNNTGDDIIDVALSIDKTPLYNDVADMRSRLYFYIEDTLQSEGEVKNRIYLNSKESYNYTVLSNEKLTLGERGNGAPLVWEWVFDVVGYYFEGTVTSGAPAVVNEYLRPIEYDPDQATFFQDGRLETVDGTTTVIEFLTDLTGSDGFAGTVGQTLTDSRGRVYFPVEVDENGNGIFIYCLTLDEIQNEMRVDTALGEADENKRQFKTSVNILAEQKKLSSVEVDSEEALEFVLNDSEHNMIVLKSDFSLSEPIAIPAGKEKILSLDGHTLSNATNGSVLLCEEGSKLFVVDGTLEGNKSNPGNLLSVIGSDLTMSGVTIQDVSMGIRVEDSEAKDQDSRLHITNCKIECSLVGLFIKGNGPVTDERTQVTVENTEIISSGYYCISGNGSVLKNGNYGTDMILRKCTLKAVYTAIFHPQKSSFLLVDDCDLEGITPLAIKGGEIEVVDSRIHCTEGDFAQSQIVPPELSASGFANTGAALYVETAYNYPTRITLSGENEFTSFYKEAILLYEADNPDYRIYVKGGSYSHDVSSFVADGYRCTKDANGRFVVSKQ